MSLMSLQEGAFRVSRIRGDGDRVGGAGRGQQAWPTGSGWWTRWTGGSGRSKARARGLSGGELLVGLATAQLLGEDAWVVLDRCRADRAGAALAAVPWAPSRTTATLAGRFGPAQLAGIEAAVGELTARRCGCCRRSAAPIWYRPRR